MADAVICDEIVVTLLEEGPVVVQSDGEFLRKVKAHGSRKQVKSALSALIEERKVLRHRPAPQGCSDPGQPITFKLRPSYS